MSKHKIFCFNNGGSPGFMNAVALGDDGVQVGGHLCSHEGFMKHDLGLTSDWHHEDYNKHFGQGNWELEWVDKPLEHAGCLAAFELNKQQELKYKSKEAQPDVDK